MNLGVRILFVVMFVLTACGEEPKTVATDNDRRQCRNVEDRGCWELDRFVCSDQLRHSVNAEWECYCASGTRSDGWRCVPNTVVTCGGDTVQVGNVCLPAGTLGTCGDGTTLILSGGRPLCVPSETAPTPVEVVCGPGTYKVGNVCLGNSSVEPTPLTCGAGTERVGNGCRIIAVAMVTCWFNSVSEWRMFVTPGNVDFGEFACMAMGRDATLERVQIEPEAFWPVNGQAAPFTGFRSLDLIDQPNGIAATSGGPDAFGIINLNFINTITLRAGVPHIWKMRGGFELVNFHINFRLTFKASSATIKARDALNGLQANVEDGWYHNRTNLLQATITFPERFLAADSPRNVIISGGSTTVGIMGITNPHLYEMLYIRELGICLPQTSGQRTLMQFRVSEGSTLLGVGNIYTSDCSSIQLGQLAISGGQTKRIRVEMNPVIVDAAVRFEIRASTYGLLWADRLNTYRNLEYGSDVVFGQVAFVP